MHPSLFDGVYDYMITIFFVIEVSMGRYFKPRQATTFPSLYNTHA